ncbi:MAG: AAA family ATPase [Candidatus Binatia bacterium]
MYNEYFGFLESPFSAAPDSRIFYTNVLYQEAFANLRYGIEWRKGLILMTGEVGTGKTTLLDKMMRSLQTTTRGVFVSYDQLNSTELLRLVSRELGLASDSQDRLASVQQLRNHLIAEHQKGHIVALLIDEAQNLSDDMFEAIRFLSNFEIDGEKLLQIVLTGQPELETRLNQASLRHLKQRIVLRCRLAPLKSDEVGRYIEFRLKEAGYRGEAMFDTDVLSRVAFYSGGIPRLINIVCDNALLLAYAGSKRRVSTQMVQEVGRDLGLTNQPEKETQVLAAGATNTADESWSIGLPGSQDPAELRTSPIHHRKNGWVWVPIAILVVLFSLGGVAGVLYSQQIKGYLGQPNAPEERRLATKDRYQAYPVTNQNGQSRVSVLQGQSIAANGVAAEHPAMHRVKLQPITSKADPPQRQKPPAKAQEKRSLLGTFEIVGALSFVRAAPRHDAKIIATLQPATQVKVVSAKGDYFRIRASVEGKTIRGYVHREDAFFERPRNGAAQTARVQ